MKPKNNIDFDTVLSYRDYEALSTIMRWFKDGVLIKELDIPEQIYHADTPIYLCPACLKFRGEVVHMTWEGNGKLMCPICTGYLDWDGGRECECGEIPHTDNCPMTYRCFYRMPE